MVSRTCLLLVLGLFAVLEPGCGAKSALRVDSWNDLVCPLNGYTAFVGEPVSVAVRAPPWANALLRWNVVDRPSGAVAMLTPNADGTASFQANTEGSYRIRVQRPLDTGGRFETSPGDGGSAADASGPAPGTECDLFVRVVSRGPQVTCPMDISTRPLQTVMFQAQVAADRGLAGVEWSVVDAPMASSRPSPMPVDNPSSSYRADATGDYRLRLVARDNAGGEGRCEFVIHARGMEALRVEMFWGEAAQACGAPGAPPRPMCDGSDVDLHLQHDSRGTWLSTNDCYFANCLTSGLEWDMPGAADNPRLDLDDTDGFGPENINVDRFGARSYRIGAHMYSGDTRTDARVTVLVYCGGSTPVQTFGPTRLVDNGTGPTGGDFWLVADVLPTPSGGNNCTVRPITRSDGRPWIVQERDLMTMPGPPPPP